MGNVVLYQSNKKWHPPSNVLSESVVVFWSSAVIWSLVCPCDGPELSVIFVKKSLRVLYAGGLIIPSNDGHIPMTNDNTKRIGDGCFDDDNRGGDGGGGVGQVAVMLRRSRHKRCLHDTDANENSSQHEGSKRTWIGCDQIANDIGEFVKRESPCGNTTHIIHDEWFKTWLQ